MSFLASFDVASKNHTKATPSENKYLELKISKKIGVIQSKWRSSTESQHPGVAKTLIFRRNIKDIKNDITENPWIHPWRRP